VFDNILKRRHFAEIKQIALSMMAGLYCIVLHRNSLAQVVPQGATLCYTARKYITEISTKIYFGI
jgi:hypothetical protein